MMPATSLQQRARPISPQYAGKMCLFLMVGLCVIVNVTMTFRVAAQPTRLPPLSRDAAQCMITAPLAGQLFDCPTVALADNSNTSFSWIRLKLVRPHPLNLCEPVVGGVVPTGLMMVTRRGGCSPYVKAKNAAQSGASSLMIFDELPMVGSFEFTMWDPDSKGSTLNIPIVAASEFGQNWIWEAVAGAPVPPVGQGYTESQFQMILMGVQTNPWEWYGSGKMVAFRVTVAIPSTFAFSIIVWKLFGYWRMLWSAGGCFCERGGLDQLRRKLGSRGGVSSPRSSMVSVVSRHASRRERCCEQCCSACCGPMRGGCSKSVLGWCLRVFTLPTICLLLLGTANFIRMFMFVDYLGSCKCVPRALHLFVFSMPAVLTVVSTVLLIFTFRRLIKSLTSLSMVDSLLGRGARIFVFCCAAIIIITDIVLVHLRSTYADFSLLIMIMAQVGALGLVTVACMILYSFLARRLVNAKADIDRMLSRSSLPRRLRTAVQLYGVSFSLLMVVIAFGMAALTKIAYQPWPGNLVIHIFSQWGFVLAGLFQISLFSPAASLKNGNSSGATDSIMSNASGASGGVLRSTKSPDRRARQIRTASSPADMNSAQQTRVMLSNQRHFQHGASGVGSGGGGGGIAEIAGPALEPQIRLDEEALASLEDVEFVSKTVDGVDVNANAQPSGRRRSVPSSIGSQKALRASSRSRQKSVSQVPSTILEHSSPPDAELEPKVVVELSGLESACN